MQRDLEKRIFSLICLILFAATGLVALADPATATNSPASSNAMPTPAADATLTNLADMDISQLMQIKVSILGSAQTVSQTPAAVSVVTADDIKRSGAQNIPQALRLVPGLDVAQLDASQWAVSARGFNDVFANKLLVMQDGRSIYTPLFSGVFWDVQGTLMDNIDHIEVVRGPGATLWGANAMNGVINIITKSAADTQGLFVTGGGGNQEHGLAGVRYGGVIGSNLYYRVYGSYENHASSLLTNGVNGDNSWQLVRGGFRADWDPTGDNVLTLQGDSYAGWIDQVFGVFNPLNPPTFSSSTPDIMHVEGANSIARWTHNFSDTSDLKLQAYYDYTRRDAVIFNEERHTIDLSLQNDFTMGDRNKVSWGLGYRWTSDTEANNPTLTFAPAEESLNEFSTFAQDELAIVKDRLSLTFGTKLEHNDYTGVEVEPGARLLWTPTGKQTFWGSISRAVRTPSRAEESIILNQSQQVAPNIYVPVTISGTNTFDTESMIAYELGYRAEPVKNLSFDLAVFYNDYSDLRSEQQNPANPTQFYLANGLRGDNYGFEATATWRVADWWRLQPSYTMLKSHEFARPMGFSPADYRSVALDEGSSPQNQASIRSSLDLPGHVTLDTALRYVDDLPYYNIESYFELDARIAWKINKNLEVSVVGQNLLHDRHTEFGPSYINTEDGKLSGIPRSIFGTITWQF